MIALLVALLAYIPSSGSLIRKAAARAQGGSKSREVALIGTLTASGEPAHPGVQLVLRFPLHCKFEGDGVSVSVAAGKGEGSAGPALKLLQLACPLIAYRGLPRAEAEQALRSAAEQNGADLTGGSGITRLLDRPVWVLGAGPREAARPQLWLYKESHAPARLIAQGGVDLRLLQYGDPAAAEWFPRVLELWEGGQLSARFEVLETHGMKNAGEDEEDDSRE